jgi:predicted transcriptional regulator
MSDQGKYWPNGFFDELVELEQDENISDRITEMSRRAAIEIVNRAIGDPARSLTEERGDRARFEARLATRWGKALDLLELHIEDSLETSGWILEECNPPSDSQVNLKFRALLRLHGRAVMTAREVHVLLKSGLSTGALARWRTAHEIWVVFSLLRDEDPNLAYRYLNHDTVESLAAQKEYEETWVALGYEPLDTSPEERAEIREKLQSKFGKAFTQPYGWAATIFDGKAPKFKDLERLAELSHWRSYYRMASHGTHANPKGILWNIQTPGPNDMVLAGPSNLGLVEPAQCTLIALANVTGGLLSYVISEILGDRTLLEKCIALVRQQTTMALMESTILEFRRISETQLEEEDSLTTQMNQVRDVLSRRSPLSVEEIADSMDTSRKNISEALEVGVRRGIIRMEQRYFADESEKSIDGSS